MYLNKDIENALEYANSLTVASRNYLADRTGVRQYWKNKETLKWNDLCTFANTTFLDTKPAKFSIAMLVYYLENGIYISEYKDKLMLDLPYLKKCLKKYKSVYILIFNSNYNEVFFIDRKGSKHSSGLTVRHFHNANNFYGSLYVLYLTEEGNDIPYVGSKIEYTFLDSINGFNIGTLDDIDSALFWHQINFFKTLYRDNEDMMDMALKNLCKFYRWLLSKYNEHVFFENSTNLTYELIFSGSLINNIKAGAYFTTFTQTEDLGDKSKIVFIIKNLQNHSTRMVKNSYFVVNTDAVRTSEYRKCINKYLQNTAKLYIITWTGQINYIVDALHFFEQLKSHNGYPNPDNMQFNTTEAIAIREYFKKSKVNLNLATLNNKIGAIRRFFQWCQKCGYMTFDATFFDYLSQYEEPNKYTGNTIPDDDLKKMNETFIELCKEDKSYKLYYAIFLILIETEFRVSQVCNLTTSALQSTLKSDQFLIYSNTKTSVGRKESQPICLVTKRILESVIEETEDLRNQVLQESYKDHIFLYRTTYLRNSIRSVTAGRFRDILRIICDKAGVYQYNSRNLRDTHMTKAFEFIMRNGKSDLELGLLSKHKHIDTTKSHYIEVELTKMLESTHQVTLGNRDINMQSKILDTLPDELNNKDTIVENGCGRCNAKSCSMTGSLPCLTCSHFVTTVNHKPYFVKMIELCNTSLSKATIRHEIEDLNLIKTLYVNWLREICIKEEETE